MHSLVLCRAAHRQTQSNHTLDLTRCSCDVAGRRVRVRRREAVASESFPAQAVATARVPGELAGCPSDGAAVCLRHPVVDRCVLCRDAAPVQRRAAAAAAARRRRAAARLELVVADRRRRGYDDDGG